MTGDIFHFISCTAPTKPVLRLKVDKSFDGIYYVCGRYSWLLVKRPALTPQDKEIDLINWSGIIDLRAIRMGPTFVAQVIREYDGSDVPLEPETSQIQSFVFLRPFISQDPVNPAEIFPQSLTTLLKIMDEREAHFTPRRLLRLDGSEWTFLVELLTPSMLELSQLLDSLADKRQFDTSTKSVLVRWKDRSKQGRYYKYNTDRAKKFDSKPAPDAHLKLATIVRNNRRFFLQAPEQQLDNLIQRLYTGLQPTEYVTHEAVRHQLEYRIGGDYVWKGQLRHNNRYVNRFALRPVSGWGFNFVFLRAPQEHEADIKDKLKGHIGVKFDRIIPRIYQITGDSDYLLPLYTTSDAAREDLENKLARYHPITIECTLPPEKEEKRQPLSSQQRAEAAALFLNAGLYPQFEKEMKQLKEGWVAVFNEGTQGFSI